MRLLFLCLLISCTLFSSLAAATSSVALHYISGLHIFQEHSSFMWSASPSHPSTSVIRFSLCTVQKRALAKVNSARLRVHDVDVMFNLCKSAMDCMEKSNARDAQGRYCLHGHEIMDFPFTSASSSSPADVALTVLDTSGHALAHFAPRQ
jgi:hypothetical protein